MYDSVQESVQCTRSCAGYYPDSVRRIRFASATQLLEFDQFASPDITDVHTTERDAHGWISIPGRQVEMAVAEPL